MSLYGPWITRKYDFLDFLHAFLHGLSSQSYFAKLGAIDVTQQHFSVKLNQISVDII